MFAVRPAILVTGAVVEAEPNTRALCLCRRQTAVLQRAEGANADGEKRRLAMDEVKGYAQNLELALATLDELFAALL